MTMQRFRWEHNRRFNAYSNYFMKEFGGRIQKVSIDAGFTCPNRDGTVGYGGCSYCNNDAFSPSYCIPEKPVLRQIEEGIEFHRKRYRKATRYLAYFQAYSNTWATLDKLQSLYSEALSHPLVEGLVIGTRPDCIDEAKLDYLASLAANHYVIVEYGIESCYDRTLKHINRGHTFEQSRQAITETAGRNIRTCAHLIFGLPGETKEEMLEEAAILSALPLNNVKFHQLQIIRGTRIAGDYAEDPGAFRLFTWDDYLLFFIEFLEHLNPDFVVERFIGEVPPRFIAGPRWFVKRTEQAVVQLEEKLEELDSWQGKKYHPG